MTALTLLCVGGGTMADLVSTLVRLCPGLPADLIEAHVRRMPENYFEWHAPAEIVRDLRLLARLSPEQQVELEMRPLGGQSYEVCVVGFDRTGVLAAITTALASDGLDTQDLRLATYQSDESDEPGTALFVDVARVGTSRRGVSHTEIAQDLRERLTIAFRHLAEGDLMSASDGCRRQRLDVRFALARGPPPRVGSLDCERGADPRRLPLREPAGHRRHERGLSGHSA